MTRRSRTAQDALEQVAWATRSFPVRVGSRLAPARMGRRAAGAQRLHLGSGPHLLEGWANFDMDGPKGTVRFDLRRPLPVGASTVEYVFTEHFLEHIPRDAGFALIRECARVLRPGGVIRISTPDLRKLVEEYLSGRTTEWSDVNWSPETPCDLLNEGLRLWGHRYIWDEARLQGALKDAGFHSVHRVSWRDSEHGPLSGLESRPSHGDLIVEATK